MGRRACPTVVRLGTGQQYLQFLDDAIDPGERLLEHLVGLAPRVPDLPCLDVLWIEVSEDHHIDRARPAAECTNLTPLDGVHHQHDRIADEVVRGREARRVRAQVDAALCGVRDCRFG